MDVDDAADGGTLWAMQPSQWGFFRSRAELEALKAALDDRGLREKALKEALTAEWPELVASMSAAPPPPPSEYEWLKEGPKVGERLLLQIDSDRGELTSLATVVGYLPEEGDDFAMWRVAHDDGDEQDLEEHELTPAIEAYNARDADGLMVCDGPFLAWRNERAPDAPPPPVATKSHKKKKDPPPPGSLLGAAALRNEILVLADGLAGGLKKAGSAWVGADAGDKGDDGEAEPEPEPEPEPPKKKGKKKGKGDDEAAAADDDDTKGKKGGKKGKKAAADDEKEAKEAKGKKGGKGAEKSEKGNGKVEKSGPAAIVGWRLRLEAADDAAACGALLLELEAAVRELQKAVDLPLDPEAHTPKVGETLLVEVERDDAMLWVEAEVRRRLGGGRFEVCIDNDEGFIEQYGMGDFSTEWKHVDGRAVHAAAAASGDGGDDAADDDDVKKLWPSLDARQRWQQYVQGARTLARVGLATVCLRDHAAKYGLLGSTATAKQAAAQARLWDIPALAA